MHKFVARTPSTQHPTHCLICPQAPTHPLHDLVREHSAQEFDLGLHVRHRRSQPLDFVDRHAANCAATALKGVAAPVIFVATDRPSRLRGLFTKIEEALGRRLATLAAKTCVEVAAAALAGAGARAGVMTAARELHAAALVLKGADRITKRDAHRAFRAKLRLLHAARAVASPVTARCARCDGLAEWKTR